MGLISSLYEDFLGVISCRHAEQAEGRRLLTFNTVTLVILPILVFFGIKAYATHTELSIISLCLSLVLVVNLFFLIRSRNPKAHLLFGVIAISLYFVFLFFSGGVDNTACLWSFVYPLVACSTLGATRGTFASLGMLLPLIYILLFQQDHLFLTGYSTSFILRYGVVYILITALAHIYQRAWEKYQRQLDQLNNRLEKTVAERTIELNKVNERLKTDLVIHDRTNRELNQHKDMLHKVLDTVPQSVFWKDTEGRFLGCNRVFAAYFGYDDPKDVIGLTDHDLKLPVEEANSFQEHDRKVINENKPILHMQETVSTADGRQMWCDTSKLPLLDEHGKPFAVLGVFDDITERIALEEALEKRIVSLTLPLDSPEAIEFENLFNIEDIQVLQDQFANATGVASIITRPDGTPLTKPSNFTRFCMDIVRGTSLGFANCMKSDAGIATLSKDKAQVQPCLSAGLWDSGAKVVAGGKHLANWMIGQVRNEALSEEDVRRYAKEIGADENEAIKAYNEIPAMSREQFCQITEVASTIAGYLSRLAYQNIQQARLISDLKTSKTEQTRLESQLTQAQKLEAVGRLAGGVAHDFNNMLGVIMGNAEMALDFLNPSPDIVETINEIITASNRSCDLTRQLLAFARKQTIAPQVLDLNETIEGMLRMLGRLIGENIDLTWLPYYNQCMVKVDPSQIDQIMANLCTNSRDSITGIGEITISTDLVILDNEFCSRNENCNPGNYACITVTDNGRGMDANTLKNLFEPFFTTKKVGHGTGLGLATVFGIVQQNKGAIEVESTLREGATFRVFLPHHEMSKAIAPPPQEPIFTPGSGETLLVVEDEQAILKITTKLLEKIGYRVLPSMSALEAIEIYNHNRADIDLLITDVIMPEMSGRELVDIIHGIDPALRVLYVSGYTDDVIAPHGVLETDIHFITKPFSKQTLSKKVRDALLNI